MGLRIGLDIGGTFTDAMIIRDGQITWGKAETTHYDLKEGFMNGVRIVSDKLDMTLEEAVPASDAIVYSTTVGTNALIERTGPRLGLLITQGFEDTLVVGRSRSWADGMPYETRFAKGRARKPAPLVPRELTFSLRERIDSRGNVLAPLDEDEVVEKVTALVNEGVRGFVVVLMNSFTNSVHERMVRDVILKEYPELYLGRMPVFLSHEVSPQMGEYRRSLTTIIDAYLRVSTEDHLLEINSDLLQMGYQRPFFLAKCTGGASSISRTRPIHLLGSGPVAGIFGGRSLAEQYNLPYVLVTDMGGTSFDAGLVLQDKERTYEEDPIFDRWRVQVPVIAHWSIGAGGGSIAHVEEGRLQVGPQSARSLPGPACYNRGGAEPTVTDADVVLGYLDPDYFLGGRIKLDKARAVRAIQEKVAEPLGLTLEEAAYSIRHVIEGIMGQELFMRTALHSGLDPRDFVVFAVGGASPAHAAGYADFADISRVAVFPFGSVFGAFGALNLDLVQTYEIGRKIVILPPGSSVFITEAVAEVNGEIQTLMASATRDMEEEGLSPDDVAFQLELEMSYGLQRQRLTIPLPKLRVDDASDLADLFQGFEQEYGNQFGQGAVSSESGSEIHLIRLNVVGANEKTRLPEFPVTNQQPSAAKLGSRNVFWTPDQGYVDTAVYRLPLLDPGMRLEGPAIVEAEEMSCAVPAGWSFSVDKHKTGWLEKMA